MVLAILVAITLTGCADGDARGTAIDPLSGKRANQVTDAGSLSEARRIDEVNRLYREGLYDRARVAADQLIAEGTRQSGIYLLKAELTLQAGDVAGTVPWCDRAIALSPRWVEPRILAARCYLQLERWAAADSVFSDLDRLFPDGPWGPYGQGIVAVLRGQDEPAVAALDKALQRDPDHLPSLVLRARLARGRGEAERERGLLLRVAQLDPTDLATRVRLADLALAQGRLEDARAQLEAAYDVEPRPELASRLADLARQQGDQDGAQRWQGRAAAGDPAPATAPPEDAPAPIQ